MRCTVTGWIVKVWLWMLVGRRGSLFNRLLRFSQKVDKWAGWEVLQACNSNLHNTINKAHRTLNKTIWLWNAAHFTINLSHSTLTWLLLKTEFKVMSTCHSLPRYSGDSHPAGKALKLVDKCTMCFSREQQQKQLRLSYQGSDWSVSLQTPTFARVE